MNKSQIELAIRLLEAASSEYSNHGCNDLVLENTEGNRQMVLEAEREEDDEWELNISDDEKTIHTTDWVLMDYLASVLKKELETLNAT